MKKQIFQILFSFLLIGTMITGCSDDDEPAADPQNTKTVQTFGEILSIGNECSIYWNPDNQFSSDYALSIIGPVSGLGNLNIHSIPEAKNWSSRGLCMPGWGYMARHGIFNTATGLQEYTYSAFYVVRNLYNEEKEIIGAEIKYCPFTPGKGWD